MVLAIKGISKTRGRLFRMFYTEKYITFIREFGTVIVDMINNSHHRRELWDNLDEVLLGCVYKEKPVDLNCILHNAYKKIVELMDYDRFDENEAVINAYRDIFKKCDTVEKVIDLPFEANVYKASDFIRQYRIDGVMMPKVKSDVTISQYRRGRKEKPEDGFDSLVDDLAMELGIVRA